ncbi:MAG TPA: autotransporter assembly complex family protein [Caulobacterales bacterium]|nr:autotransporter assembly complex family protein [Caulobacterales bacterium]
MRLAPAAICAAGVIAASASAPAPALARTPVVIEGVSEDERAAIEALLPDRERPTTLFEAERISEEAAARALAWMRAEGYYAAEVTPEAEEEPPLARLNIAPGPRFHLLAPDLVFDGARPDADTAQAASDAVHALTPDAPARAADVLQAEANALTALREAGYADAQAGERRVIVDHAASTMKAEFHIAAGARVRMGDLHADPADLFRQDFLDRLRSWRVGDTYDPEALSRVRRDMAATGAVASASTHLAPVDEHGLRDIIIDVSPAKRNAYELGAGYSTTEGVSVDAQWTRRNFSHRADSIIVSTTLGELAQSGTISLVRPAAAGYERARHYSATLSHEDTAAYSRQGIALSTGVDADRRLRLGLSYGLQLSADEYDQTAGVDTAYVLSAFADLRRDTTGAPLDARHGSILDFRLEPSVSTNSATVAFTRAIAEARFYESFGEDERFTFAERAKLGWEAAMSGDEDEIPPDRRFYAGGGGSVRGYEYNSIYPRERDALGLTPGGQGLFEFSAEARMRIGDRFGVAAFVDGGNAFDEWSEAADLRWGVGLGARYNLGFAPLRVDIATPLDPEPGDPDFAIYISLGQAF